jgi:hypothetical protein
MHLRARCFAAALSIGVFAAPAAFAQSTMSGPNTPPAQTAKPDTGMMKPGTGMMMTKKTHHKKTDANGMSTMSMSNGAAMKKTTAE